MFSDSNLYITKHIGRKETFTTPKNEIIFEMYNTKNHTKSKREHILRYTCIIIYTVSQKRDPDIIDCNFGKD